MVTHYEALVNNDISERVYSKHHTGNVLGQLIGVPEPHHSLGKAFIGNPLRIHDIKNPVQS